jgi:hypothetical protein
MAYDNHDINFVICVNVQTTHENISDLINSNGLMLTGVLVNKRILQTRKGGLDGTHAPFHHLPH